ncbi:MAG: glutamate--tRNA ligase [Actinobacteria bacterium]|nr:glutamate--tRNA ligase [Actinomycetota bacterium]
MRPVDGPVRVRFAPAPTGYLHLGSARAALFNWLTARHLGGSFLLRIEDTDLERSQQELVDVVFEALEWMGLDWDEAPVLQSTRGDAHRAAVHQLVADGRAYWSDPVPESERERTGGRPYDPADRERGLGPGEGRAVRFRTPDEGVTRWEDLIRGEISFDNATIEDFVLLRADGSPTFFVANAVDDHDMAVTHVIRGEDLINVTPKQLLLRSALGQTEPIVLGHMPLIVNEQRKKLSKRRDDVSLLDYRDRGFLAEAMVNYLALLGWGSTDGSEIWFDPLRELPPLFDIREVNDSSAFFDAKKLLFVNAEHLRALGPAAFAERTRPYMERQVWADRFHAGLFGRIAAEVQKRVETLAEAPGCVEFLFLADPEVDEASWAKAMVPDAAEWLDAVIDAATDWSWESAELHERTFELAERLGVGRKRFQAPIRVALTGRLVGLPLFESMEVLGREEVLRRLRTARERLGGDG